MSKKTNRLVKIAILSATAFVVMLLETPPLFSTFLKLDFSDVIAVIGGFAISPLAGVVIQLVKNLLHLMMSSTSGVGELGNFIVGGTFVFVAAYYYHRNKSKKQAIVSLVLATLAMTIIAVLANLYILLPLYANVLGFTTEAVVALTGKVNPMVHTKMDFVLFAIAPFNVVKGIIVSIVTFAIYKNISKYL